MKEKSKVVERILKRIEDQKNDPNYKPKERIPNSKDWQIGFLTGEYIISHFLPSIKGVGIEFRNSVEMSDEDAKKHSELLNSWTSKYTEGVKSIEANNEWIRHREFEISLDEKYLPGELECHVPKIDSDNLVEVKFGIRASLWNCDGCSYEIATDDDIIIEKCEHMDDTWSVVKLKLSIEKQKNDLYKTYGQIK